MKMSKLLLLATTIFKHNVESVKPSKKVCPLLLLYSNDLWKGSGVMTGREHEGSEGGLEMFYLFLCEWYLNGRVNFVVIKSIFMYVLF